MVRYRLCSNDTNDMNTKTRGYWILLKSSLPSDHCKDYKDKSIISFLCLIYLDLALTQNPNPHCKPS
ncbi:hypothetical protein Hdeb2414_s0017g00513791 [Helianthus debilis subsp. tardiflorus]